MTGSHVLVVAKFPRPGHAKTRLVPPLTPIGAAEVAAASLADTLEAVAACGARRRYLALDGPPGPWIPQGFDVFAQEGTTFNERLSAAWSRANGPGLQIGMDTPQVTAGVLDACLESLDTPGTTAALGLAPDGGWWAIGFRTADPRAFDGITMSTPETGAAQLRRLEERGHRVVLLPMLRDIDVFDDGREVAAAIPESRFAKVWERVALDAALGATR
jgi:glycosyltransferase A (GT-A) superfamily protein (DUF2064 family)